MPFKTTRIGYLPIAEMVSRTETLTRINPDRYRNRFRLLNRIRNRNHTRNRNRVRVCSCRMNLKT